MTKRFWFFFAVLLICLNIFATASSVIKKDVVTTSLESQFDTVRPDSNSALAIHFAAEDGWHFYADPQSAPGGMDLKVKASAAEGIEFAAPIFPESHTYYDKTLKQSLAVFSGDFTVYVPFRVGDIKDKTIDITIQIKGAVCSAMQCMTPTFEPLAVQMKVDPAAAMDKPAFEVPPPQSKKTYTGQWANYPVWLALLLAVVAGLGLNIMPCVWPVLPLIVMRIVSFAENKRGKSFSMGLAFSIGILLFFACLAVLNIVLQLAFGTALQWGDQLRQPSVLAAMSVILVALAMFMFGAFQITLPVSVGSKQQEKGGYIGSVGMGFLAAILSTPCGFGILAAAIVWAQTQHLALGTITIMVIGLGMALPYLILTSIPSLLNKIPRAGKWMEIFKQAIAFLLLGIAIKLMVALPEGRLENILYFSVILGFALWMWGQWIDYNTKTSRKIIVRGIAVILTVASGWFLLKSPASEKIDWQSYDPQVIQDAIKEGRPVLIKWTADWCLSCKVVQRTVYSKGTIADLIAQKNVLAVKGDTTESDFAATKDLKNIYNEPALPVSMLFIPGQDEPIRWHELFFANELAEKLKSIK
ncbi:MAG: cytochrome c biogenesis protein CcdA [Phycisphaerae bacterium]|nr:cytochrome c biogenesis protein CcdA [Phycisphaerae bacterium]